MGLDFFLANPHAFCFKSFFSFSVRLKKLSLSSSFIRIKESSITPYFFNGFSLEPLYFWSFIDISDNSSHSSVLFINLSDCNPIEQNMQGLSFACDLSWQGERETVYGHLLSGAVPKEHRTGKQ